MRMIVTFHGRARDDEAAGVRIQTCLRRRTRDRKAVAHALRDEDRGDRTWCTNAKSSVIEFQALFENLSHFESQAAFW